MLKNTNILFAKIFNNPMKTILYAIVMFLINCSVYQITSIFFRFFGPIFPLQQVKIAVIDDKIPLVKIFVIFYYLSFVVWLIYPALIYATDKRNRIKYLLLVIITSFVVLLIFIFYPTYIDRIDEELYEQVNGNNFLDFLLRTAYNNDGKNIGYNLFPSVHCLATVNCYYGIKDSDLFSKKFKIFTIILSILIFLSTVFTKQHYILDVIGGVAIPIIVHWLIDKTHLENRFLKV